VPPTTDAPTLDQLADQLAELVARVGAVEDGVARLLELATDTEAHVRTAVDQLSPMVEELRPLLDRFLAGKAGRILAAVLARDAARPIDVADR
jgi:hypothetical protein